MRHPKTSVRTLLAALFVLAAASAHAERARVTTNRANLRAKPQAESAVVWTLDRGTEVEVLARSGDWWQVRIVASGTTGWMKSNFLTVVEPAAPAAEPIIPAPEPPPTAPPAAEPVNRPAAAAERADRGARQATRVDVDSRPKFKIELDGAFGAAASAFNESRTYREFAEDGVINTDYKGKAGPGFEVGLQYRFTRSIGVNAAFGLLNRDEDATFDAQLPHPLYFNRDREASGALTGYKYKETAFHLGLVVTGGQGTLSYSLFAGPSFIKVESDVLDTLQYSHSYPYDTVTVTATPAKTVDDNPIGFHVGGGLDFRLGNSFGLGTKVRFARAKAKIVPVEGEQLEIDAGGLSVTAGLRLFF
jgi:opacity protein-like surface antigen